MVGLGIASFALINSDELKIFRMIQFLLFGVVNSMQFTAMNTYTMRDIEKRQAGDANSLFSMVQMLAVSFSVAAAGSMLAAFLNRFERITSFHLTFICMGLVTCISAWIFWQIDRNEKRMRI
jgi:MFS family permease